jgi:transcriptional regulator GlxA family with amidase domain
MQLGALPGPQSRQNMARFRQCIYVLENPSTIGTQSSTNKVDRKTIRHDHTLPRGCKMERFSQVYSSDYAAPAAVSGRTTQRRIGIALFNGFALPATTTIVEAFHAANADLDEGPLAPPCYDVVLVSGPGGRIASSSSVFVWTDSVEANRLAGHFDVLFVAGGKGVATALRDERLLAWLRSAEAFSDAILPVGEGRLLLEAAGIASSRPGSGARRPRALQFGATHDHNVGEGADPLRTALAVIESDYGKDLAQRIGHSIRPETDTQFAPVVRKSMSIRVSEPIQLSARWLAANSDRDVSVEEAADVATMSPRNFLRRFKMEMGVTPSEYLLHVRLDTVCRMLSETSLPVDKIARRCGIGSGGRLAKLFRKHLGTTPTEYRAGRRVG